MEGASARYDAPHVKDILLAASIDRKSICMWHCVEWSPRSPPPDKMKKKNMVVENRYRGRTIARTIVGATFSSFQASDSSFVNEEMCYLSHGVLRMTQNNT